MYSATLAERFWKSVRKTGGCWLWTASTANKGYGQISDGRTSDGRTRNRGAHRVSWELHFGPVPGGLWVLHRCDVAACVRPDHLFLGTQRDNETDKVSKGRGNRGERHGMVVLTESDVIDIRTLSAMGAAGSVLAREFGVTQSTICDITKRRSWAHVP